MLGLACGLVDGACALFVCFGILRLIPLGMRGRTKRPNAIAELNNAGLFSRPAANIPTNIVNLSSTSTLRPAGWFGVSAVSVKEVIIEAKR